MIKRSRPNGQVRDVSHFRICMPLILMLLVLGRARGDVNPSDVQESKAPDPRVFPHLTTAQWLADLDTLVAEMPKQHGNLFHALREPEFRAAVQSLRSRVPSMNDDQVVAGFAHLVALVQDGHNRLEAMPLAGGRFAYPLRLFWDSTGIYVSRSSPAASRLVGGRLLAIDGRRAQEAAEAILSVIPHDEGNTAAARVHVTPYMTDSHLLHGLGIAECADSARWVVEREGTRVEETLYPQFMTGREMNVSPPADWADARDTHTPSPLWLSLPDTMHWFEYLSREKILFVQINGIGDAAHQTLKEFSRTVSAFVQRNDVQRLVLDLRRNGGGNNYLVRPLIIDLIRMQNIDQRGRLFVLTSPMTFSAAQNLVNRLQLYTEATFVGEPTGENVNFYGDTRRFTLPNSRIRISLANLYWQDMDPRDKRKATYPEIAVDYTFQDYCQNRDPALALIRKSGGFPSIEETVLAGLRSGGMDAALRGYRAYTSDPVHRYQDDPEYRINALGYSLLSERRLDDAITVFQMNVQTHPESWNTWDSLGEGLAAAGRIPEAISAYEKSLRLNPTSATGLEALARLRK